ncbi:MAG: hypothetical protein ACE5K0_10175 [Candidatus Methanofastidiosia archaeon]
MVGDCTNISMLRAVALNSMGMPSQRFASDSGKYEDLKYEHIGVVNYREVGYGVGYWYSDVVGIKNLYLFTHRR